MGQTIKVRKLLFLPWLCLVIGLALPVSAQSKYSNISRWIKNQLFQRCVPNEDYMACYLYGGLQNAARWSIRMMPSSWAHSWRESVPA
jgi:hypothetical protein